MSQHNTDEVLVADVIVGKRFRQDLGNINDFAAHLDEAGLFHPIGITPSNELIFGQRRLEAAKQLGWEHIPARVIDPGSLLLAEWAENEFRKELTPSERVEIGKEVEKLLGNRRGNPKIRKKPAENPIPQLVGELEGRESAEVAASTAGFDNPETYRQAKKVVANGTPTLVEAMDAGDISIKDAATVASEPESVQEEAVESVKAGKVKTARQAVNGTKDGFAKIDEWLGKVVREADALQANVMDRYAQDFKKNLDITRRSLKAWERASK